MPLGNRNVQTVLAEEMADAAQSALLAAAGLMPICFCRRWT